MSNYIINQIQLLDKSLDKCNYDINNNINELNKLTIQKLQSKYNKIDIISYVKQLNNFRLKIKNMIFQNELIIYDTDKKKIVNKNINTTDYTQTENILYSYNFINENIKKTLKNIIIEIK